MAEWTPPLPPDVRDRLRDLIGLVDPDQTDELHVRMASTVNRTRALTRGDQLSAIEADLDWALMRDGTRAGDARVRYEHLLASGKARLMVGDPRMSVAKATVLVDASDEAFQAQLVWRVAEARVSAVRAFLRQVEGRRDVWRTHRADERAADSAHAQGFGSHA